MCGGKRRAVKTLARTSRKQIVVLLPPREAEHFDAYCEARGYKKSTLIARLIRDHLDAEQFGSRELRQFRERKARYQVGNGSEEP